MMVRLAGSADAEQLFVLNEQFNGKNCTTVENIRQSLSNNAQKKTGYWQALSVHR